MNAATESSSSRILTKRRRARSSPSSRMVMFPATLLTAVISSSPTNAFTASPPPRKILVRRATRLYAIPEVMDEETLLGAALVFDTPTSRTQKRQRRGQQKRPNPYDTWTEEVLAGEDDMDDDDSAIGFSIQEFQALQYSLGPDVVDEGLQKQIDEAATTNPNVFLDSYVEDATSFEKFAMSTLPQQLPRPAVTALNVSNDKKKKGVASNVGGNNRMKKVDQLNYARGRVTPEQEIELGKKIQEGVRIHKIKLDFEAEHGREITRAEWSALAGFKTNRELRKRVSVYRNAKQLLVYCNMGLVHAVVNGRNYKSSEQRQEMVQEGSLGLLRAAELFDPSRGIRFSTYATIWIKGMLSNTKVNDMIVLPLRERTKWNKIRKAQSALTEELERPPKPEEIAKETGLKLQEVVATTRKMTQARSVLSLDYAYSFRSRSGLSEGREASLMNKALLDDADVAEKAQLRADLIAALAKNLDAREERLIRLRYGLADGELRTLHQCAEMMGISYYRAQSLAKGCLKKLREASEAESLQEYLLTIA